MLDLQKLLSVIGKKRGLPQGGVTTPEMGGVYPQKQSGLSGVLGDLIDPNAMYEDRIGNLEGQYANIASQPAQKQDWKKQGLFVGGQFLSNLANQQLGRPYTTDVQLLGNAKKEKQLKSLQESLAPLYTIRGQRQQQEDRAIGNDYKKAQTANIYDDNSRLREDLKRKQDKDATDAEYKKGILQTKIDANELKKMSTDQLNDYRNAHLEEIRKHNRATETQAVKSLEARLSIVDKELASREKVAGMNNSAKRDVAQIQADARKAIEDGKAAARRGDIQAQNEAKERYLRLKAEMGQ